MIKRRRKAIADRDIFIADAAKRTNSTLADIATVKSRFRSIVREGVDDVMSRYRRSFLGPAWNMVNTIVFVLGFMLLGTLLLKIEPAQFRPYIVYVTCGVVFWSLISSIITEGAAMYTAPRTTGFHLSFAEIPVRMVIKNLTVLAFNLITVFGVAIVATGFHWEIFLFFPGLALAVLVFLPVAVILGIFGARMRDFSHAVANLIQFGFYLSPVFWRASDIPNDYPEHLILDLNPFYYVLSVMRDPMTGVVPPGWHYIVLLSFAVVAWALAAVIFTRFRRRIIYWA